MLLPIIEITLVLLSCLALSISFNQVIRFSAFLLSLLLLRNIIPAIRSIKMNAERAMPTMVPALTYDSEKSNTYEAMN